MDPHAWPCKSRTTSTNIHSAAMWGYGMFSWRPALSDEQYGGVAREGQEYPCYQRDMMMMMMMIWILLYLHLRGESMPVAANLRQSSKHLAWVDIFARKIYIHIYMIACRSQLVPIIHHSQHIFHANSVSV